MVTIATIADAFHRGFNMRLRLIMTSVALVVAVAYAEGECGIAPIVVERRAEVASEAGQNDSLLLRELARQGVIIAAERAGLTTADLTIVPHAPIPPSARRLEASASLVEGAPLQVELRLAGAEIDRFELPVNLGASRTIPFEQITAAVAMRVERDYAAAMVKAGGAEARAWGELPAPETIETMLDETNAFAAFRAARETHNAIAADGESPDRLAALARAYANLGESSRPLLTAHYAAFFARALLYAERLVMARPDAAQSYWTRAYVRAMIGLPGSAREDVKRAVAISPPPPWALALESYLGGDAAALLALTNGDDAIAEHFAMRNAEFCQLGAISIRYAQLAYTADPANLRAYLVANDNGGVSTQAATTLETFKSLDHALAAIAQWTEAPQEVRAAAAEVGRHEAIGAESWLKLWAALRAQPVSGDGPLPWGVLGELARESAFVIVERRLYYLTRMLGVDASDDLDAFSALIDAHPCAPILTSYVRTVPSDVLTKINVDDEHDSFQRLATQLDMLRAGRNVKGEYVGQRIQQHSDATAYDLSNLIWRTQRKNQGRVLRDAAQRLLMVSPGDPVGTAALIRAGAADLPARLAQYESMITAHPAIGWQLGEAFIAGRKYQDAVRVLQAALKVAPVREIYLSLASAHQKGGDLEAYVGTIDSFVKDTEDFGLDHSSAQRQVALVLVAAGKADRALKYAEAAAQSHSHSSLVTYADALGRNNQPARSAEVWRVAMNRYGTARAYDCFYSSRIYGFEVDPAIVVAAHTLPPTEVYTRGIEQAWQRVCLSVIDGKLDDAVAAIGALAKADPSTRSTQYTDLAAIELVRGKSQAVQASLELLTQLNGSGASVRSNAGLAVTVRDILAGRQPPKTGTPDPDIEAVRAEGRGIDPGSRAHLIGRACEAKGHADPAKSWYLEAARAPGSSVGRLMAVMRLRELGIEPFK